MTQPNLIELAKQGDPQAIATLMNLTLQPKGVVAKAVLEDHCLHVFLSAARALNAETIVAFIQRGIQRLEVSSIQRVQVYGQRLDGDQPDWVEAFVIYRSDITDALEALSHPSSTRAGQPVPLAVPPLLEEWKQRWSAQMLHVQTSFNHAFMASKQWVAQWRDRDRESSDRESSDRESSDRETPAVPGLPRPNSDPANYLKLSAFVTLIAFVTGGAVALLANSYTVGNSNHKAETNVSAIAANSQQTIKSETERNREQQQATARKYLETMNQAQQTFYRQNNRFASTLEELERFAAVPFASRSDYVYKLTVPSRTQSQLSAVPKADGLKSFTAAVSIAKTTNQAIATICTSQQAAKLPPLVFQSPEGTIQCPVESTKPM